MSSAGLEPSLAKQVAEQLMAHDALGAHARDELGISETLRARPIQAAWASAGSFAIGAVLPLLVTARGSGGRVDPSCFRDFTAVPRASRRAGCTRGRRKSDDGRDSCHLPGYACHGDHLRRRVAVPNSCVNTDNRNQTRFWSRLQPVPSKRPMGTVKPGFTACTTKR